MNNLKVAFFGTPKFAVIILEELKKAGIIPTLIVTAPDKPQGRGLKLTPPPVKVWSKENNIPIIQPATLKEPLGELTDRSWDLFLVAAYGKIIPENILEMSKHKTLNVHPSLLPKYRGPSPIETAILNDDKEIGVTIMRLDKEMDHGPIVSQEKISPEDLKSEKNESETWPMSATVLEEKMAHQGGMHLAKTIPNWIAGKISEKEQDHSRASYCKKITKADGLIDLSADPYQNYLKICAFAEWPGTYFFADISQKKVDGKNMPTKSIRVSIKKAIFKNGELIIESVVPEGRSEMPYLDFLRGIK